MTNKDIETKAAEIGVTIEDSPSDGGGSLDLIAPHRHHFVGTENHVLCEAYGIYAGPKRDAWRSIWKHLKEGIEPCIDPTDSEYLAAGCFG